MCRSEKWTQIENSFELVCTNCKFSQRAAYATHQKRIAITSKVRVETSVQLNINEKKRRNFMIETHLLPRSTTYIISNFIHENIHENY